MSPVGSRESLMAALQAGAGSVYFGVGKLNMRSRSTQNFGLDDLDEIANLCGERDVRTYLTLNSVIFDEELAQMRELAHRAKDAGISAIIASDLAVIHYVHSLGMPVHMSTQTNITNTEAVRFWSRFADVMVMARELNLDQVKAITQNIEKQQIKGPSGELVRIEIFVHGALCMAVSGKCYLSLDNLGSSANRGACLQPCRRGYTVRDRDNEVELEVENEYIMSPKDLNTIGFLDKILDAGVQVLKIEGRGRAPEYVKVVTEVYREAVAAIQQGDYNPERVAHWNARLSSVYNRGFWDGYYLGRKTGEWSATHGSEATERKIYVGRIENYFARIGVAEVRMDSHELCVGDKVYIIGPTTGVIESSPSEIRVELSPVEKTVKGERCSIPVPEQVRTGDKVYKVVKVAQEAGSSARNADPYA
ncbi:MAG TPA: peptidase U32 family protein [Bacteroidales bacterium]|nr:peptidase U32 family protein [Bacteroidales bacterium]